MYFRILVRKAAVPFKELVIVTVTSAIFSMDTEQNQKVIQ